MDAPEHPDLVTVARFDGRPRAERVRRWLQALDVGSVLVEEDDGFAMLVRRADESRALDIVVTLVGGLDTDNLRPQPWWKRVHRVDVVLPVLLGALSLAVVTLVAWWVLSLAPVVPLGVLGTLLAVSVIVAFRPGRRARMRRELERRLGR